MSNQDHDVPDAIPVDVTLSMPLGGHDVQRSCRLLTTDQHGNFTLPSAEMVGIALVGVEGEQMRTLGGKLRIRNLTIPIRVHELSADVVAVLEMLNRSTGVPECEAGMRAIADLILQARNAPPLLLVRPINGEQVTGVVAVDFPEQGGFHAPPVLLIKTAVR